MGITGLWDVVKPSRDWKAENIGCVYVDGWYYVIRIATAMKNIRADIQDNVIMKTILARRRVILGIPADTRIIVFDGEGSSAKKLPRTPLTISADLVTKVYEMLVGGLGDICTIVNLSPGTEADDYIISSAAARDIILSDDSDMLLAGCPVMRYNGDVYVNILSDISARVGKDVTLSQLRNAAKAADSDKHRGPNILKILQGVYDIT